MSELSGIFYNEKFTKILKKQFLLFPKIPKKMHINSPLN
jgi:hypothetical protein